VGRDAIEFFEARQGFAEGSPVAVIGIRINEVDLRRHVSDAGGQEAKAGDERWNFIAAQMAMGDHWFGSPSTPWSNDDGRIAVLNCTCGDLGCGGVVARIAVDGESVTWSEFSNPRSSTFLPLGPFRFDRSEYSEAVSAVSAARNGAADNY
jgi:hypothetical protein